MFTIFIIIAATGLTYVKWWPYYDKALTAIVEHSIGSSIIEVHADGTIPSWQIAWNYTLTYFKAVWKAALLGILLGTLVQSLLPSHWLLKLLGKANFKSTAIGGMASIPGMMCSCCAAPIAIGLRKKHVSVGSALAFWIGNPTINPATLIFMAFVLSWEFTLLRLIFGIILTFGVSYLANRFAKESDPVEIDDVPIEVDTRPLWKRWLTGIRDMVIRVIPAYFLAVLLLGALQVWMFPQLGTAAGNSLLAVIFFALMGMLFVIPTAAEIPIIQAFMAAGLGAGPASALLLTLPAISLPSLLMVRRSFPRKVIWFVAASVIVLGIACGITGMIIM
ncbi:permease [Paenibacillus sp. JCM 10914]